MTIAGESSPDKLSLWREYRAAFQEFARTVENIKLLQSSPNPTAVAIEIALLEQEKAHLRYNESRDALATALLAGSAYSNSLKQSLDAPREDTQRVKEIAELLWEFENKRDGKADEDWFHAEKIIRRAKTLESVEDADLQEVLR